MADFQLTGADDLARLGRQLRQAGRRDLQRELYRGINAAAKPLDQNIKYAMDQFLPDQYAAELAASLKTTVKRRGGKNPSVRLVGKAKTRRGVERDLSSLNRGRLRHPLFGNRRHWFNQAVRTGWWDHPIIQWRPEFARRVDQVVRDVMQKIEKGT